MPLTNLYRGLVVDGRSAHSLFDLTRHGEEGLFDVRGVLSGCLQERDTKAIGKLLNGG